MHIVNQRQKEILRLLKRHKHLKTYEIAEITGKSMRTIRTDLQFLREQFWQIEIRHGRYNGGVYWHE